jgi:intracellular sulfur oxidation DsrE/DsrF family protein
VKSKLFILKGGLIILEYKVIFHVDELNKWDLVLKNTGNLVDAIDTDKFNIEVLANSEAVKAYVLNSEIELDIKNTMKTLSDKGIKFVACNNALKAFDIKKEDLITFVYIVPVGVLELINKQMEGYSYIKP